MRKRLILSLLMGVTALMATQGSAKVYSPWVISEHVADTRDEARFAADPRWSGLTGQEKALAVWRYLTDRETGTWHYSDMWEGRDPYWESKLVKDPVKILNVYGFSVCTMHASMIEGLYEALGFEVRQQEFGGYHRTAEVGWEGKWHYLDVDERAHLIDNEGNVLSVTEAVNHPEFWERSAEMVSPFYPQNGGIKGIRELAKRKPGVIHWHWRTLGHSMDFSLRPGESLTRYWQGQGRWRVSGAWQDERSMKLLSRPPAGPKTARRISANNSYANGEWVYHPNLSARHVDLEEGAYRTHNIKQDGKGVTLAGAGTGWVEWRVRTPYIIVPDPNNLADPADDEGAAVVRFSASGPVEMKVSTDQGRHWETALVREGSAEREAVDLTKWVAGHYEYHVRFDLSGRPGRARLDTLKITTWVQVAPNSLPRLTSGINNLRFTWGDKHELPTEVMSIAPEFTDAAEMQRWEVEVEGEYRPAHQQQRARGPVTLRVKALAGSKLRWLHVGGACYTHRAGESARPDRILYALSAEGPWHVIGEDTPPGWNRHWYYNVESEVALEEPAREVWVRLDPAVSANALRVYAHCEPDGAEQRGPVVVTHGFRVDEELVTRTFRFNEPRDYQVRCDGKPENVYVRMSVPSRPK